MNATKRATISEKINIVTNGDVFQIREPEIEGEKIVTIYGAKDARRLAMALLNWSIYEAE